MSSASTLVLQSASLTGRGVPDFNSDSEKPLANPGVMYFFHDRYGPRIAQYIRNRSGSAFAMGELAALLSDAVGDSATSVANITAGSTTSATASSLTANNHDGMICYVLDNADSAGAAPEGEASIVASNTATVITLEPKAPLSTALAVNDDLELIANYQCHDSADGDHAVKVAGVVLGKDGISDGNYGWVQNHGPVMANITTAATTVHDCVVADAAVLGDGGTDGIELWCGTALAVATADQVAQTCPVRMSLFQAHGLGTP